MTDLFDPLAAPQAAATSRSRSAASRRAAARRRRRRQRTALVLAIVFGVLGVGGYLVVDRLGDGLSGLTNPFATEAEDYPGPGGDAVTVEIPEGATGADMGTVLQEAGVVASVRAFTEAYSQNPAASSIQPGTYQLQLEMRAADAVSRLVSGEKVETTVTIPEGFTVAQVLDRVASVTAIPRDELQAALEDPAAVGLPAVAEGNAEGWLFPKTYTVQPDHDATTILSAMIEQTKNELTTLGVGEDRWQEVLTKASIVEKEAPDDYRGEVARVIENRLDRGSPLGMDAIDAYGRGKPADQITKAEFNDPDFPYASRQQVGLPPTPIANPGAASVEAVIDPPPGDWMWYVTVNLDTGETKFTDSYSEFEKFKAEYQAWAAENG